MNTDQTTRSTNWTAQRIIVYQTQDNSKQEVLQWSFIAVEFGLTLGNPTPPVKVRGGSFFKAL